MNTMTTDELRLRISALRREADAKRLRADDVVRRMLREDESLGWPMAIDAVEEILALRDQVDAMRITICKLDAMLPEELTDA